MQEKENSYNGNIYELNDSNLPDTILDRENHADYVADKIPQTTHRNRLFPKISDDEIACRSRRFREPSLKTFNSRSNKLDVFDSLREALAKEQSQSTWLKRQLAECQLELKTVSRQFKVQNVRLNKAIGKESELPLLIDTLREELRCVRYRLRLKSDELAKSQRELADVRSRCFALEKKVPGTPSRKVTGDEIFVVTGAIDCAKPVGRVLDKELVELRQKVESLQCRLDSQSRDHQLELSARNRQVRELQQKCASLEHAIKNCSTKTRITSSPLIKMKRKTLSDSVLPNRVDQDKASTSLITTESTPPPIAGRRGSKTANELVPTRIERHQSNVTMLPPLTLNINVIKSGEAGERNQGGQKTTVIETVPGRRQPNASSWTETTTSFVKLVVEDQQDSVSKSSDHFPTTNNAAVIDNDHDDNNEQLVVVQELGDANSTESILATSTCSIDHHQPETDASNATPNTCQSSQTPVFTTLFFVAQTDYHDLDQGLLETALKHSSDEFAPHHPAIDSVVASDQIINTESTNPHQTSNNVGAHDDDTGSDNLKSTAFLTNPPLHSLFDALKETADQTGMTSSSSNYLPPPPEAEESLSNRGRRVVDPFDELFQSNPSPLDYKTDRSNTVKQDRESEIWQQLFGPECSSTFKTNQSFVNPSLVNNFQPIEPLQLIDKRVSKQPPNNTWDSSHQVKKQATFLPYLSERQRTNQSSQMLSALPGLMNTTGSTLNRKLIHKRLGKFQDLSDASDLEEFQA